MTPLEARAEVRTIISQIEQVDDPRLGVSLVRKRIAELHEAGESVPEELVSVEKRLIADCIEASQGR